MGCIESKYKQKNVGSDYSFCLNVCLCQEGELISVNTIVRSCQMLTQPWPT